MEKNPSGGKSRHSTVWGCGVLGCVSSEAVWRHSGFAVPGICRMSTPEPSASPLGSPRSPAGSGVFALMRSVQGSRPPLCQPLRPYVRCGWRDGYRHSTLAVWCRVRACTPSTEAGVHRALPRSDIFNSRPRTHRQLARQTTSTMSRRRVHAHIPTSVSVRVDRLHPQTVRDPLRHRHDRRPLRPQCPGQPDLSNVVS